jgi:hypothetical protein
MAKTNNKENLFEDFFYAAKNSLAALEQQFKVTGVLDQVFGKDIEENIEQAQAKLRASRPWATLSSLYDYAIDGMDGGADPMDIVIDGSDVLKLVSSENHWPSAEWEQIVAMADGRYALDEGMPVLLYKMALLANVDVRTVRNAVSAGELVSFKTDDEVKIENASARKWLHGRRGFKPTVTSNDAGHIRLETLDSPMDFGAYLVSQRKRLGLDSPDGKLVVFHPAVTQQALAELEAGVFALPLDAVFPIADFYQVGRKELLECVMRVFFYEELQILSGDAGKEGGPK